MRIAAIETRRYRFPLEPPLRAAWDPQPRTHQDATLVCVVADDGARGYASGDALPDAAALERLLAASTRSARRSCARCARPSTSTAAVPGRSRWRCGTSSAARWSSRCGGSWAAAATRFVAYASSVEPVPPAERARRCVALRDAGVRAVKLRFGDDWRAGVEIVEAVREAVGRGFAVMIDANQGWRMPGDLRPRWDVATAIACARALEPLGVEWLEEPLRTDDVDGYAALRRATSLRIAAGEMVRDAAQARDLVVRGGVDVIQPDVVLAGGIGGARRIAALADLHGRTWSPHTWSNGYGLVANLHAALAFSTCPYVEVPFDPPAWPAARRDWLLPAPVEIAADGTIRPPDGPGLGVEPDFDALDRYRVG